jgi:hypothetical protein
MAWARAKTSLRHEAAVSLPATEAQDVAKLRLTRTARGAVIAVVLALVVAAPVAAAQPTRIVFHHLFPWVLPAGSACAFDVIAEQVSGFAAKTTFSDGAVVITKDAPTRYTNEQSGASVVLRQVYRDIERFDLATGVITGSSIGQTPANFVPGDRGPFGVVTGNGALFNFIGTLNYTYDTNTNVFSVSYSGTVTDICALLS